MLKRELIAALARQHRDLKIKDVDLMAQLVFETMKTALAKGDEIELRGFGSFRQRHYQPRQARNPGTGEQVNLGSRYGVLFRTSLEMKERLNAD